MYIDTPIEYYRLKYKLRKLRELYKMYVDWNKDFNKDFNYFWGIRKYKDPKEREKLYLEAREKRKHKN